MKNSKTKIFRSRPFYCRIYGDFALFTDPTTKGGGEKFTYSIPTYEALRGIIDANCWKPTITNVIEECKIMNPIRTQTKGILVPLNNGKQDRYYYTYLTDVCYEVKFHFTWNLDREDLAKDRNEIKHTQIILRSLERGGRHDIFLGTRECVGYIERLHKSEYYLSNTAYEKQQLDFGIQFHSFKYPSLEKSKKNPLIANFDRIRLVNGKVVFRTPDETELNHEIFDYSPQTIRADTIESVTEALQTKEYREEV
jgi:CRISPR-associated protein Cas5d